MELLKTYSASSAQEEEEPQRLWSNSNQRTSILKKAKLLKDSDHFKQIFVRPSYTLVERIHIKSLYNTLQSQQEETGVNHFIDRRGPVNLWTVKRKDLPKVPSVNGGLTASASKCPTKGIRDTRQVLAFYVVNYSMHALSEISLIIYLVCYNLLILM